METLRPVLSGMPFFDGMSTEHLDLIVGCAANVRFAPGDFVARRGGVADQFFIVRKGRLALQVHAPGRGDVTLQTLGDDEIVGWAWLVPPYRWHLDVRALTETRALSFDGRCLRTKFEADPRLGYDMMTRFSQLMSQRIEAVSLQLLDLYAAHA